MFLTSKCRADWYLGFCTTSGLDIFFRKSLLRPCFEVTHKKTVSKRFSVGNTAGVPIVCQILTRKPACKTRVSHLIHRSLHLFVSNLIENIHEQQFCWYNPSRLHVTLRVESKKLGGKQRVYLRWMCVRGVNSTMNKNPDCHFVPKD